jgi:hypothetical protein
LAQYLYQNEWTYVYQTASKVPHDYKIYQMSIKYSKWL